MHASSQRAAAAYAPIGVETDVQAADPHQLVEKLFAGALLAVASARLHLERGDIAGKGAEVATAITIINNGLRASLDLVAGGALAQQLAALYDYMTGRLLDANIHGRTEALGEVHALLSELNEAWGGIAGSARIVPGVPVADAPSPANAGETR